MFQACDASLARLGADWIDIMYLHQEDHDTPLEETVIAMADLIRSGKVRYFGVSNYRSWRLAEICNICDRLGIDRPVVSQPYYNAMNRMPEVEHLPACGYYGLGVVPYSPLARGVLTGKYDPDVPPPEGTRAGRQDMRMMQTEWRRESLVIAQEIRRHAEAKGITPVQFAFAWVLNNRLVTAAIAGPRTLEQFEDYLPALEYRFGADDEELVDSLVATGHPSTPGFNDPGLPDRGPPDLDRARALIVVRALDPAEAERRQEELTCCSWMRSRAAPRSALSCRSSGPRPSLLAKRDRGDARGPPGACCCLRAGARWSARSSSVWSRGRMAGTAPR